MFWTDAPLLQMSMRLWFYGLVSIVRLGRLFSIQKRFANLELAKFQCRPNNVMINLSDYTCVQCVVCMSEPRQVRFGCGHFICCQACASKVMKTEKFPQCPTCRVNFFENLFSEHVPCLCFAAHMYTSRPHSLIDA